MEAAGVSIDIGPTLSKQAEQIYKVCKKLEEVLLGLHPDDFKEVIDEAVFQTLLGQVSTYIATADPLRSFQDETIFAQLLTSVTDAFNWFGHNDFETSFSSLDKRADIAKDIENLHELMNLVPEDRSLGEIKSLRERLLSIETKLFGVNVSKDFNLLKSQISALEQKLTGAN